MPYRIAGNFGGELNLAVWRYAFQPLKLKYGKFFSTCITDWLWGAVAQWSEHLQLKQEALGLIPSGCPGFFLFQLAYTNVNGTKDLWCSSTVRLLSTQI